MKKKVSIPLILFLALLHFECYDIYNEYSFLFEDIIRIVRSICVFLHKNIVANILLAIYISYLSVKCIIKRYKDEYLDINHIIVLLFILLEISFYNLFSLKIIGKFEYKHLMIPFILIYLFLVLIKVISKIRNKGKNRIITSSFVIDTAPDSIINIGWDNYVQSLVYMLKQTDLTRSVFSVGISSEWGSGKTFFMEMIENEMKDNFFIIKFNPWNSNDATHIIRDYFNLLKDTLSLYNSKLANPLSKYMKVLSNINFKDTFFESAKNIFLNNSSDNNINTLKSNVENCILQLNKPVAIFIDDLDRLKDDELFEVLKLIRTTAQFKNMVYIVAFDRGYTANMLESKNINDGYKYIEKIFNVEITLPYYERNILEEYMLQEFKLLLDESCYEQVSKVVISKINGKYKVSAFFKNFREIKRFINQFILNFNTIYNSIGINDIIVSELFKLELIHFFDDDFYQLLKNNPKDFLYINNEGLTSEIYLGKKDSFLSYNYENFVNDYRNRFNKKPIEKVFYLLYDLFSHRSYKFYNNNSITFSYNYYKYFSLRIMRNQIKDIEFKEFISSSEPEKILEKFESKHDSLAYHFRTYKLSFIQDFNRLKLFYNSLFYWINKSDNEYIYGIFRIKTEKDSVHKTLQEQTGNYIIDRIEWLIGKSNSSNDNIKVTILLKNMYMFSFFDDDGEEKLKHESLITNDKIIELANKNFESFLKKNNSITPQDLIDKDSLLYRFTINSVIKEITDFQGNESAVNIIIKSLAEFFATNTKYDPKVILKYFTFIPEDNYENDIEYDHDRQKFITKIETIFGSVDTYKNLISKSMPKLDKVYLQKYLKEQEL